MLNDFQFYENGVDYGTAIRDKSKNFVNLLRDSERFKNERQKSLATKDRLAHSTGLGVGIVVVGRLVGWCSGGGWGDG